MVSLESAILLKKLTRPPTESELERSLRFLTSQVEHLKSLEPPTPASNEDEKEEKEENQEVEQIEPELQALTNLCQTLMGSSEFLYID